MNTEKTYYCRVTNPKLRELVVNEFRNAGFAPESYDYTGVTHFVFPDKKGNLNVGAEITREILTIDEFLTLLDKPKSVEVKIGSDLKATVYSDEVKITMGSYFRTVSPAFIASLSEAHKKVSGE